LGLFRNFDTKVRAVDQKGNIKWQEGAKIMVAKGRPASARDALASASPEVAP